MCIGFTISMNGSLTYCYGDRRPDEKARVIELSVDFEVLRASSLCELLVKSFMDL